MGVGVNSNETIRREEVMEIPRHIRLRVLAKKFKATIPDRLAVAIPDSILQQVRDGEETMFMDILIQLGCFQELNGKWSRE